jgi:hypothetical protein
MQTHSLSVWDENNGFQIYGQPQIGNHKFGVEWDGTNVALSENIDIYTGRSRDTEREFPGDDFSKFTTKCVLIIRSIEYIYDDL